MGILPKARVHQEYTRSVDSLRAGDVSSEASSIPRVSIFASHANLGDSLPNSAADLSLPPDIYSALASFAFFNCVSPSADFLAEILPYLRIRKYGPHDVVLKYGDTAKAMFFTIKGILSVVSADREVEFAELTCGSFCTPNLI